MPTPSSMVNQQLWLQKETMLGAAATSAMKRYKGLKMTPVWDTQTQQFKSSGSKLNDANQILSRAGKPTVDTIQDFNAMLPIVACNLGAATDATPVGATTAKGYAFSLDPDAPDAQTSFTAIWGDSSQAVQLLGTVFNSLKLSIQRGQLGLDVDAISFEPSPGATLPSSGTSVIPSMPVSGIAYDVFADDTWADLGTTQLLACYEADLTLGDKYVTDAPINSSITSYENIVEAEDTEYSSMMRVAFDAVAVGLISTFVDGALKFFRIKALGPKIETIAGSPSTDVFYTAQFDFCALIKNPSDFAAAPNSPVRTLGFDLLLTPDPTSGKAIDALLINTVPAL